MATDLDGTLIGPGPEHALSDRTVRTLRAVAEQGVTVVVVTARPPRFVAPLASVLGLNGVAICLNGALTYDLGTGRVVAASAMPLVTAQAVAGSLAAAAPDLGFAVETGHQLICEPAFRLVHLGDPARLVDSVADLWPHADPLVKLMAWSATTPSDELMAVAAAALAGLPDPVECTHSGGPGLLEISATGVSKAAGLMALCATLGVAAAEVVAFGDMPNDIAMLRWAGTGYAVANAHADVLAAVPGRAPANVDDGVAVVLERLFELRRAATDGQLSGSH